MRMFKHQRFHLGFVRPENCVSFSCFYCRRRDFIWISWLQWRSTLCTARVTIGFTVTSLIKTQVLLITRESWFFGSDSREPWAWQRCFVIGCETFYRLLCPHTPLNSTQMDSNHLKDISREDGRCSELRFSCQKGLKTSICWRFYSLFPITCKKKPVRFRFNSSL